MASASNDRGFTLFFTGLPASGKTTLARGIVARLRQVSDRPITLLDGDVVRAHTSADLGYSKKDRDAHVRRIGVAAAEVTKAAGVAVCSVIAPYDAARQIVRARIAPLGEFVLVWVSTPLDVCERRDPKGLYAKARAGLIRHFTGISDPYEPPTDADILIDTTDVAVSDSVERVVAHLQARGLVR